MEDNKTLKPLYRNTFVGNVILGVGILTFFLFMGCAAIMLFSPKEYKNLALAISSAWVVGVPVYFFFEHVIIFRKYGDPGEYEQFKRVQDLAAKIWAGAILVLAAIYSANFLGP